LLCERPDKSTAGEAADKAVLGSGNPAADPADPPCVAVATAAMVLVVASAAADSLDLEKLCLVSMWEKVEGVDPVALETVVIFLFLVEKEE
jgi:hypothetical protein